VQVAWQNGLMDLAMPFMIQFMKDYVGKVDTLMADRKDNMEARKVSVCNIMSRATHVANRLAAATEPHASCLVCCVCMLYSSVMSSVYQCGSGQSRNRLMLKHKFVCTGVGKQTEGAAGAKQCIPELDAPCSPCSTCGWRPRLWWCASIWRCWWIW